MSTRNLNVEASNHKYAKEKATHVPGVDAHTEQTG
jgi:hypothetical protein